MSRLRRERTNPKVVVIAVDNGENKQIRDKQRAKSQARACIYVKIV